MNDVVEFELGTDENGNEEAVNVSLITKAKYAIELSKLRFKDFGLDIKNNILNPPKSCHDEYCLVKLEDVQELRDYFGDLVCECDKQPCCVVVLKNDNTVIIIYSDKEYSKLFYTYRTFGIKEAPKEQQYLAVGELVTKSYKMEHYGIMLELEDNFYQTIMK